MSGKVIGTTLPYGFRGGVTRNPDNIVSPFHNVGGTPIEYGEPVVFDPEQNGVRRMTAEDSNADNVVGFAVRRMGQPHSDSPDGWYYGVDETVDVLIRGSMTVELAETSGAAARGKVFVCNGSKATESDKTRAAGAIVASSGNDAFPIPNVIFATGKYDGNNIAEITILTRSI